MPAAITGQNLLVNYTRDAAGMVRDVWILTPDEARAKRASAEKPLLNFWPFVSADSGPRDDGKTPFNQLPTSSASRPASPVVRPRPDGKRRIAARGAPHRPSDRSRSRQPAFRERP